MKISIKWFEGKYPSFNVELASEEGKEPFLTIKSCQMREHEGKEFISFPSKKLDSGKYWNHIYASDAFQAAVLAKAKETMPTKQVAPQPRTKHSSDGFDPFDDAF